MGSSSSHASAGHAVEQVYAEALLDMAGEAGQLNEVADELKQLGELLQTQPQVQHLLSSQLLSTAERASSIEAIFKGRVSDLLYRFLQVVNEKQRLDCLAGIILAFSALQDERQGIIEADAYVASPLTDAQVELVSSWVSQRVDRNVVLRQVVDPRLIGGVKIRVGDQLIDGSVVTQLRLMREAMVATGREKARTELDSMLTAS